MSEFINPAWPAGVAAAKDALRRELRAASPPAARAPEAGDPDRPDLDTRDPGGRDPDRAIQRALAPLVHGRTVVAGFAPRPGEPGGVDLPDVLAGLVTRVLLPVLRPDRDLDWALYTGGWTTGRYGIREPAGPRLGPAAVADAQVVVVPALAVGRDGSRLGRGGGSYDRALARVPAGRLVVALVNDAGLRDAVPVDPHDRPVSAVITPSGGLLRC